MGSQSYYQKSDTRHAAPAVPRPLRWLVVGLALYILVLVALPIQMTLDHDALVASIRENRPDLNPDHMGFAITATLIYAWGLHAVVAALCVWFGAKAVRGRRWARIALTIYLVAAFPLSVISVAAGTMYLWAAMTGNVIQAVLLALLWAPRSVRRFFAGRPVEVASRAGMASRTGK